jgi:dTMP kinase
VIYLDMPTETAVHLLRQREEETHTQADIHEVDTGYLAQCRNTALEAAPVLGWTVIPCTREGAVRSIEDIHQEIWNQVEHLVK